MTREQVELFITKTPTHYRDLRRNLWFRSLDEVQTRPLYRLVQDQDHCSLLPTHCIMCNQDL
jgi:hypothetical protein